jgi:hypothetical protein
MPVAIEYQTKMELAGAAKQYAKVFSREGAKDYGEWFPSVGRKIESLLRGIKSLIDESDLLGLTVAGKGVENTAPTVSRVRSALFDSIFIIRMTLLWCTKQSKQFKEGLPCLVPALEEEPTTPQGEKDLLFPSFEYST